MAEETREMGRTSRSAEAYTQAVKVLPGGVNSPVRAFGAVGGHPIFAARGEGAHLIDLDGNRYIDYVLSWGPLAVGHAHPDVVRAVTEQAMLGTSFGVPTELETTLAQEVLAAFPSMGLVRMVNSGTEATMSALRLARAFTGRSRIVKFSGCYHGHADSLLIRAGSGVATFGLPDSPGVPEAVASLTLTAPYNDLEAVRAIFQRFGEEIAAVIVEPVAGNMGLVLPEEGFLQGLRKITEDYGSLLIFDEVMTGFRVGYSGAQGRFGVTPDLTTLGKVIGGGLPVGAYGGRKDIVERVAPTGPVYQAGTLSGNPLAMAAGLATLRILRQTGTYEYLESAASRLAQGIRDSAMRHGRTAQTAAIGGMFGLFFTEQPVRDYETAQRTDRDAYRRFFHGLLRRGVYLAPSPLEAGFVSLAHSQADVDQTLAAVEGVFAEMASRPSA